MKPLMSKRALVTLCFMLMIVALLLWNRAELLNEIADQVPESS